MEPIYHVDCGRPASGALDYGHEFHASIPVPEGDGKTWYARFEETAQITDGGVKWLIPTQKELFLIEPAE